MCRKFLYAAAILALFAFPSYVHASGYFLEWRPFSVRSDLVLEKSGKITAVTVAQAVLEQYSAMIADYGNIVRTKEEKKEKKWDEFQYGNLRLRLSRYHDWKSSQDIVHPGGESGLWGTIKTQLEGAPNRDTLEAMGRIFAPEFDVGIEF
jgi:hypothetical protein